jgi:hypothetical protein
MQNALDQILLLRELSTGDADVVLDWARPFPAWAWALLVPTCLALALWSYSRLSGKLAYRMALGTARALVLLMLAILISGPQLVKQTQRIEKDWVALLLDRSASMNVADAPGGVSREAQLKELLEAARPSLAKLSKDKQVLLIGFDGASYELPAQDLNTSAFSLPTPQGTRTRIDQALQQTLKRLAARPVAGIAVVSDGRSADAVSRETLKELDARQIPVFSVPMGSERPLQDLVISRIDAPHAAFVSDPVPIVVSIDRLGDDDREADGNVELVDTATGAVIDSQPLALGEVILTARPSAPGSQNWAIRVVPSTPDLSPENNVAPLLLDVADRPVRVLYLDGYPRWEYRYLKYTLVREKLIQSAVTILSPDRRYLREGSHPIDSLPNSPEEWSNFDVIILGDLRPELFSADQLRNIRAAVATRGVGLLWLGGPAATPSSWKSTPLADLIPFSLANFEAGSRATQWLDPVVVRPGESVRRYGVLQLGDQATEPWPEWLGSGELGWTLLRWAQKIEPSWLKPASEVLGIAVPVVGTQAAPESAARPLIISMRYGAGRIVYVGTDEIWRFRYGRGETLPERFWIPLVRLLARESLGRSGKPALLEASPARAEMDQQVQISARLLDQSMLEARPKGFGVRITPVNGDGSPSGRPPVSIELRPSIPSTEDPNVTLVGQFAGAWLPSEPGIYSITPSDPMFLGLDLAARVEVVAPSDELRQPQSNHALLRSLAEATRGKVLQPGELGSLAEQLPNRELRILGLPRIETLWDKPLPWALIVGLLVLEWIFRRIVKLP